MNSIERRDNIIKLLLENNEPIKGNAIAKKYSVTRQVIVKDIAILRAKGKNIIATPDGYIINKKENKLNQLLQ
jgi:transcriptional regulator of NAD metabolism